MKSISLYLYLIIFFSLCACKKEYERPDHYALDLFENERNEQGKKILSKEDAIEKSLFVVKSTDTKLVSSPKINGKLVYIYNINSGKMLKTSRDSLSFPTRIISDYDLKFNPVRSDSATIFLINPKLFKLLIEEFGVKYQTLPSAPIL